MNKLVQGLATAAFILANAGVAVQAQEVPPEDAPALDADFPIAAAGTEGLLVKVAETGHVFATFQGHSAAYTNYLQLNDTTLFSNWDATVGSPVDLGEFTAGAILDFRMYISESDQTFYMGAASRNLDDAFHARAQADWAPGTTLVSFEDLSYGPYDFNDLSFSVSNTLVTSVPEPGSAMFVLMGIMAIAGQALVKRSVKQAGSRLAQAPSRPRH